ncbi:ABC transporter ATP-binding protein [Macrococcus hajekii]|uniref:ABC transporter ATP-binding protein n=1 Tax=Macrococcus hajekii TaxID=198482 RepID=A0A4R6BJ37_9STAP|nr:ABC transporter ATP-binding protein [Macrococcus hajekii]TDM01566.1 ABC transporter ATP-binding protein [Macrococcus hajekii]GGB01061.1 ABC transporter ATP-binding protein [Macrococcus hajekii]
MEVKALDVTKQFDCYKAVDQASLTVEKGTIHGLLGSNGAGKTTFLKLLAGIYRPDSGEILYDGEVIYENPAAKEHMIFMPDIPYFFNYSNLIEMAGFYKETYPKFSTARFKQLVKLLQLNPKQRFNRMSKGMKRQAAFILSLSCYPDVLLLDEPFDGLDPVVRHTIKNLLIQDVSNHQMSILVSSHNLREMEDFCDSISIMHEGAMLINRELDSLKREHSKVQVAFETLPTELFYQELKALDRKIKGRVVTCITQGSDMEIEKVITRYNPLMYDILPLTLEEIFTYEMGGHGYAIENIIVE